MYDVNRYWKTYREKILKWSLARNWYYMVNLYLNWKRKFCTIHRLVLITFEWLEEWKQVNHKNWVKIDNELENLEWMTQSENTLHASRNWLLNPYRKWKTWKLNPFSKQVNQYTLDWEFIKTWDANRDASRELWITQTWISACATWKNKTAWWFIWKYNQT